MKFLKNLTEEQILKDRFPLEEILKNSLYYPSSGFDGAIVKHFSKELQSFILCDYARGREAFLEEAEGFRGYKIIAHRDVLQDELIPNGWNASLPPMVELKKYFKYQRAMEEPFAHWVVYERLPDLPESHGAERFSLLYIGGEGVASYQALYQSNKKSAKILAIVQPGTGFGLIWTDFRKRDDALAWVVMHNPYGMPDKICYGGIGKDYMDFSWPEYEFDFLIPRYYGVSGEATVWKRVNN